MPSGKTAPSRSGYTFITWKDPTNVSWTPGWSGKWTYKYPDYGITEDNNLTLKALWGKSSDSVVGSYGNVNWGSQQFGFEIYLQYKVYYDGSNSQGTYKLYGYYPNGSATNYLCGTFKFGNKTKTFSSEEVDTNGTWASGSGPFGSGSSISWSWSPTSCPATSGPYYGVNMNTWTSSKSGTISLN